MLRLASPRFLAAAFFALALAALVPATGCGRTGLFGDSIYDCPPDLVRDDGTCGPGDGGVRDGFDGGDGFTDCLICAQQGCDRPGCCACAVCQGAFFCQTDMKGDGG